MFDTNSDKRMIKFLIYFSALILLLLMSPNSFAEGNSGLKQHIQTVPEGYVGIYSKKDLNLIRKDLSCNYILMNDIHFTESDFKEGGSYYNNGNGWKPLGSFSGTFDGNGYTINGLEIYSLKGIASSNCGLFAHNSGTIKNLGMSGTLISLNTDSSSNTGSIAGSNSGVIENCYNTGTISSTLRRGYSATGASGGITGENIGNIKNCYNSGAVSSYDYAGGIVGENLSGGTVKSCYNIGTVTLNMWNNSDIEKALNVDSGSIVGSDAGEVSNCYSINLSEVHNPDRTGVSYLSQEELKDPESFSGFDFQNTWEINPGPSYPFPQLQTVAHRDIKSNTDSFSGGNGSLHAPYIITTKNHLNHVRDYPGAYYILDKDLTFTESDFQKTGAFYNADDGWAPICPEKDNSFFGYFDGNGHTINGIKIMGAEEGYNGLFGYNKGVIRNLSLANGSIKTYIPSSSYSSYTGGIAGNNGGAILNCSNSTKIEGYYRLGGIAGINYGVITDSHNSGEIYAKNERAGGITGEGWDRPIRNCYNTGTITSDSYAAGISAYQHSGVITGCFNAGDINANKTYAGGIVSYSSAEVSKSFNTGGITADGRVGGIAGMAYKSIKDCYNTGNIGARTMHYFYAGGIAGESSEGYIERCYNIGCVCSSEVGGSCYTGGITALHTTVKNCYSIDVTGYAKPEDKGVLYLSEEQMRQPNNFSAFDFKDTWYIDSSGDYPYPQLTSANHVDLHEENTAQFSKGKGTLQEPYIIKTVSHLTNVKDYPGAYYRLDSDITFVNNSTWYAIGADEENAFYGCFDGNGYTIGEVQMFVHSYEANVYAGFFGYNRGIIKNLTIFTRNSKMSANSYSYFGGIVGQNKGTIINCHHSGWIQANGNLGGIAGENDGGIIADSYNTANLKSLASGSSYLGGIAAQCSGTITTCYNIGKLEFEPPNKYAYVNGIVGYHNSLRGTVNGCYYLEDDSFRSISGTNPLSLDQMKDLTSFSGFDFDTVWQIDSSEASKYFYPQLRNNWFHREFSGVSLKPESKMIIGNTLECEDFSNHILAPHLVKWSSSDENIATVDENGTVTGKNYGSTEITATALYGNISSSCKVTVAKSIYGKTVSTSLINPIEYTGKEQFPEFTIQDGETPLQEGIDYEFSYKNNVNAGTGTIYISGLGDYHGTFTKHFTITPKPFDSVDVSGIKEKYFDGTEQVQTIQIKDGEMSLDEKKDYIITYEDNIGPGTATMTINGQGNYSGSIIRTFKILKSIEECTISGIENRLYTGSEQLQNLTVKDGDKQLEEGTDFTVSYSNHINAGTASVVIEGINDYYGTLTYNFAIRIPDISGFKVINRGTTFQKLSWNKVNHATGYQIFNGSSIVKTVMGSNSTSASITGLKPGCGYTFSIRPFVKDSVGVYYGKQSDILSTPTIPEDGKITKITKKKRSCTVKWEKRTGTGYQLVRSTNPKFKKNKKTYKITSYKKCSKKMTKLKRKKTYYVKIRSYKIFGGKTVYGSWSKVKKFKIK